MLNRALQSEAILIRFSELKAQRKEKNEDQSIDEEYHWERILNFRSTR